LTENAGHEVGEHEFDGHEIEGHEIGGHKSQQLNKLYNMHMHNMLKCIKYYENINQKLARGEQ